MANALFITREEIVKFTALNGNIDSDKFIQFIKIAQDTHIYNYLGSRLFKKISDDIVAGTLAGNYVTLLNDYIKPMLIHWSMVEVLPFISYQIANKGMFKHNSENSTTVDKSEVDFLIEKERQIAQNYSQKYLDYMVFNYGLFPEYNLRLNGDKAPILNSNFGGWYLQ
jgi:hypothetical protein